MPKPPTFQRPIPVNRNWSGRPGDASSPFGKPGKRQTPRQAPERDKAGLQLDLKLPKLPALPKL